jgi:hypothetical protein
MSGETGLGTLRRSLLRTGVVVALHWDYACWTALASQFTRAVQGLAQDPGKASFVLLLSGVASPRLRKELEARGFRVEERAVAGPLR